MLRHHFEKWITIHPMESSTTNGISPAATFSNKAEPPPCEVLEELGYVCAYTLLNAAFYGVPQTRERMFLIAYHREVAATVRSSAASLSMTQS